MGSLRDIARGEGTAQGVSLRDVASGRVTVPKPAPVDNIQVRDIFTKETARELWPSTKKVVGGIGRTFVPAITNFFKTTGSIMGEGLAYATDKNVRQQYEAGNLDILPTITKTTQKDLALDTVAAGLETAVFASFPKIAQMSLVQRGGAGAIQGMGAAIAAGIAEDKSPEEIVKSLPLYGVGGAAIAGITPYLIPILAKEIGRTPPAVKQKLRELVQKSKPAQPAQEVMPEVPPEGQAMIPRAVPDTVPPTQVVRTADEFQSITAERFRQEAIKRGLDDVGEVPLQQVQRQVTRWRMADEVVNKNPEEAVRMLRGTADAPTTVTDQELFGALRAKVLNDPSYGRANPKLVQEIAELSNKIGTEAGRGLKALDRPVGDTDPLTAIQAITKARQGKVAKEMKLPKGEKPKIKSEVKTAVEDITKQQMKLEEAQKVIDSIRIC